MPSSPSDNELAPPAAAKIYAAFKEYHTIFREITERARERFKNRDRHGMRSDATERLDLYKQVVGKIEKEIRRQLEGRLENKCIWVGMKTAYSELIIHREDRELAETFYNSITRRIFSTVGVDRRIEFVGSEFELPASQVSQTVYRTYRCSTSTHDLVLAILSESPWASAFQNINHDAQLVSRSIEDQLHDSNLPSNIEKIDIALPLFYRGIGVYIIGRITCGQARVPLAIALLNQPDGVIVDAVLTREDDISLLFSFTRSYFHVQTGNPYNLVSFIKSILPLKRIAEIYISIGFNKHGKTELYRELLEFLSECRQEQFQIARGEKGMVMIAFNIPNDDLVFKLIRDRFENPKKTTRDEVMRKYDLVFMHDRAGRLVDAQSFEHLKFDDCFFSSDLLAELQRDASHTVQHNDSQVVVLHAYVERLVTPLDIYLREAPQSARRRAVIDFGNAIKDLAVSNIFPGDILLKNFGVTRLGRVVFYDYDEICPLTSCNFRKMPPSASYEDEMSAEPWFLVDENDVFPEEFKKFLSLPENLKSVFLEYHSDLFEASYWQQVKSAIETGDVPHIYPYSPERRLRRDAGNNSQH